MFVISNFALIIFFVLGIIPTVFLVLIGIRFFYHKNTTEEIIPDSEKVVLKITVPKQNDKGPIAAEQLFSSLHGIIQKNHVAKSHFSFEIVAGIYGIYFIVITKRRYKQFVENQIYAQYPDAQILLINDYAKTLFRKDKRKSVFSEVGLARESFLPIKTFANFDVDPLASITSAISKLKQNEEVWIQFVIRPIDNTWQQKGKDYVESKKNTEEEKEKRFTSGESYEITEIENKNKKVGFQFVIRILSIANTLNDAQQHAEDAEASFKQYQTSKLNTLTKKIPSKGFIHSISNLLLGKKKEDKLTSKQKFFNRFLSETEKNVLNIEEVASIFHLPNKSVQTPRISWVSSKKVEYPINLPDEKSPDIRILGYTDYRNQHKLFGIKKDDRRRHKYIIGKTGTGKSTLMKNLILSDIYAGEGVGIIDPHGDLIDSLLKNIPPHRLNDVVLFDPSDFEYPFGLNLLELPKNGQKDITADTIVEVFKKHFGDSWGPRLQYILLNTILTLLECKDVSMLAILRILVDKNYRTHLLKQVKDPVILNFWENEFAEIEKNNRMIAEVISPIQNKVGRFITSSMIRNIIGQTTSTINIDDLMNSRKIFLINLSQGQIGEENSSLLGGMIITRLFSTALSRVSIPENQRKDFYLYVDEFQNFATPTFVKILSEARKYRLNLVVAHQYIDQIGEEIANAIFGNVGTMINFNVGPKDAQTIIKEYTPYLEPEDLVNLDIGRFIIKMMINGSQSRPFTAISPKSKFAKEYQNTKTYIQQQNRKIHATPREKVENKILKWSKQQYSKKGNPSRNPQTN